MPQPQPFGRSGTIATSPSAPVGAAVPVVEPSPRAPLSGSPAPRAFVPQGAPTAPLAAAAAVPAFGRTGSFGAAAMPSSAEPPVEELGAENLPNFKQALVYQLAQVVSRDPEQLGDIVKTMVPNSRLYRLGEGGPLAVELPDGKRFYLNRPGMSRQDAIGLASDLASGIALAVPAGRLAKVFGAGRVAQIGVQSLAGMAGSAGLDVAAAGLGSEQGVSVDRMLLSGAGAAGGEFVAPWVGKFVNFMRTVPGARLIGWDGKLSATGEYAFREAGIDPSSLSPEQLKAASEALKRSGMLAGDDAVELARRAANNAAPDEFGIRRSLGQRTGDPVQLGREDMLRGGGGGNQARETMGQFDQAQRADVESAIGRTGERMTGRPMMDEATIGQEVMTAGRARYGEARELEDQAWAAFRFGAPREFTISARGGERLRAAAGNAVADFPLSEATPTANRLLKELQQVGLDADGKPVAVDLLQADRLRRMFTNATGTAAEDRRAIGKLRGAFDDWLYGVVDRGLAEGDPQLLGDLRAAVGASRDRFSLLKPAGSSRTVQSRLQSLVEDDLNGQQIANWMYGAGQLSGGGESRQTIKALQGLIGDNEPAREAIRQGALVRLLQGAKEDAGGYKVMADRIREALNGNGREVSEYLFSEGERQQLGRFERSLRTLSQQRASQNPSGTAWTLMGALTGAGAGGISMLSAFGDTALAVAGALPGLAIGARTIAPGAREVKGAIDAAAAVRQTGKAGVETADRFTAAMPLSRFLREATPAVGSAAARQFDPDR